MTSPWFINFEPVVQSEMRLFCFPNAGGSAATFRAFATGLPQDFEVWAANLPGHGSRLREAPLLDLKILAAALADALEPLICRTPFAFFGYSWGARLAFEVARNLRLQGQPMPQHLFVAACAAPHLPQGERQWHTLPDVELLAELCEYNGIVKELQDEPQILALLLPGLRADLTLYETAGYDQERPFDFPITAFGGDRDPLFNSAEIQAWQDQTSAQFQFDLFDGDHFFLRAAQPAIFDSIANAQYGVRERE